MAAMSQYKRGHRLGTVDSIRRSTLLRVKRIIILLTVLLLGSGTAVANDGIESCRIGSIPEEIGPMDRIYILASGYCSERTVAFSLEEIEGSGAHHAIEINVDYQRLREHNERSLWSSQKFVLIIDPVIHLRQSGKYRLTVRGRKWWGIHLRKADWPKIWKSEIGPEIRPTFAGTTEFTVTRQPEEPVPIPGSTPLLTGHTISHLRHTGYTIGLCVALVPEVESSPDHYLYVVEILSSEGQWLWLSALRPPAPPERDPRCAYIVQTDILSRFLYSDPGSLSFRPMLLRSDGIRWRGPIRTVPVSEAE